MTYVMYEWYISMHVFWDLLICDSHFDWDRDDIYEASIEGGATRLQICPRKTCSPDLNIGETSLALMNRAKSKKTWAELSFWISDFCFFVRFPKFGNSNQAVSQRCKNLRIKSCWIPNRGTPGSTTSPGVLSPSEWRKIVVSWLLRSSQPQDIFKLYILGRSFGGIFGGGFRRGFWSNS